MIYELRIYSCIPGRMPALLKRFEEQTMNLWDKHGIKQAGFWTMLVGNGNNDLYYLLAWESLADREKKWNEFQADPAWHKARDESEKDGFIIANISSSFLRPTAFSAVK
jgi:NIPSNAP